MLVSAAQVKDNDITEAKVTKFDASSSSSSFIQIILQSMHKYKPRVHIIRYDPRLDLSQIQSLPAEGVHSFSFPETEFTTVTAYQNQQVTTFNCSNNRHRLLTIITHQSFDQQGLETAATTEKYCIFKMFGCLLF